MIKVTTIIGFIIFAIIDNVGGVPTDPRGYIGFEYWGDGLAFRNGFHGFCAVFVTAAFSFAGTELVGLTAAETKNPEKQLPRAIKQTVFRIVVFYLVSLLMVGLLVRADNPNLLNAGNDNTKDSIFVLAFINAGVKGLPSVMNVVITLSVLSVANSCTYGSTRTIQALAARGMLPKFLAFVDRKGRPIPTIILQLLFAMLAFVNEAESSGSVLFGWLLALSAIAYFFVWGSICAAHIRFRMAWKANGRSVDELPYKASFGVWGSWLGLFLNFVSLVASIYVGVSPITGEPFSFAVEPFFQQILAIPTILFFYICYKIFVFIKVPEQRPMWIRISKINIYGTFQDLSVSFEQFANCVRHLEGMRESQMLISGPNVSEEHRRSSVAQMQGMRKRTMGQRFKSIFTDLL
jgi:amino acid transporter